MVGFLGHRAMKLLGPVLVASFAAACSSGAATPSPAATATVGSAAASASAASTSGPQVTVSILLPDNTTPRYESQDKPAITAALTKYIPNVKVTSYNALGDGAKQLSQAEEALTNGSKVLIVIPQDSNAAAAIVAAAHKDNVPVIAYTRIINNSPLDYFIGKDTLTIGKQEGQWIVDNTNSGDTIAVVNGSPTDQNAKLYNQGYMGILQPLFTSGQRKLGGELWTPNWDPTSAQNEMDQLLTKNADNVQAVIGPNDNMAGGVVASLTGKGLAGKVKVTGLDATVAGLQRIMKGTQGMTVAQDIPTMGDRAGKLASMLVAGQTPPADFFQGTQNNGSANVPTIFVNTIIISKQNIQTVIDLGFVTKDQLCQGIPAGTSPC